MTNIHAYLTFNGNCREAMTFYKESLGGELTLQPIEGTPMAARCPEGMLHHIMHASLAKGDMLLMATDMIGPAGFNPGNTISLSLICSSEEEINTFFKNLSAGGQVVHELSDAAWGALFGVLVDKYGVAWMLNYDKTGKQ